MVVTVFNDLGKDFRVDIWDGDGVVGADLCVNCRGGGGGGVMLGTRRYDRWVICIYWVWWQAQYTVK
jgi:hypothetical protein